MANTKRRSVLKLAGGTALGGMAGILATGRTPAYAQQKTVHWLKWVDFVPATDQMFNKEMMPAGREGAGHQDQARDGERQRPAAAHHRGIQSGAGADLIMSFNSYTHLYANSVVDMSAWPRKSASARRALPRTPSDLQRRQGVHGHAVGRDRRHDRLSQVVARRDRRTKFPDTWETYREVAKKLKAKGRPFGQTLGHTFGDAPGFTYPYLWSWGGKEVEADGKTVGAQHQGTIDSVKFMTGLWKDGMDEGGLAWDDTNNNRAFLSQTISATLNGASIYIESLRKPDQYKTEKGAPLNKDILHAPLPKGPAGSSASTCCSRTWS
jgi:multiple sugar transport system substrate-binding protein